MAITDPRDIASLVAWYSAEAETGYANGAQMTGWTDLSGNGNDATAAGATKPIWRATGGPGGGQIVDFTSSGYFTLPNLLSGATAGEIFTYIDTDNTTNNGGHWAFGQASTTGDHAHFANGGFIYDSFGLPTGNRQQITPGVTILNTWRRYNVWAATNDWAAQVDGVNRKTYSAGGAVFWRTNPTIGRGADGTNFLVLDAQMTTVLIFNQKLTSTERADVDAWMVANPSGGAVGVPDRVSLTETLPALTETITLRSYTRTLTDNQAGAILIRGASIEPVNAPDVEPVPATVSEAEMRDKAVAYTRPSMINGRIADGVYPSASLHPSTSLFPEGS